MNIKLKIQNSICCKNLFRICFCVSLHNYSFKFLSTNLQFSASKYWTIFRCGNSFFYTNFHFPKFKKSKDYCCKFEIHSFLNSKKTISISEITSIERIRNYEQGKADPISDGYYYSQINVSDGFSFSISPDKFSNYSEIMIKIKSSLKN